MKKFFSIAGFNS